MRKVQVINGSYGYLPLNGTRRITKTPADAPFDETDVKAVRYVKLGVLAYADATEVQTDEQTAQTPSPVSNMDTKAYNSDMKMDELKRIAKDYGIDNIPFGTSKIDLLTMLDAATAKASIDIVIDNADSTIEPPPLLNPTEPKYTP